MEMWKWGMKIWKGSCDLGIGNWLGSCLCDISEEAQLGRGSDLGIAD